MSISYVAPCSQLSGQTLTSQQPNSSKKFVEPSAARRADPSLLGRSSTSSSSLGECSYEMAQD